MFFRKKTNFTEDDLEEVIQACRSNDSRAQRVLFQQFFGYAKGISLRYSSSMEEAEEILNESFLKVFQHIDRYDLTQPFKAWLRTIVVNTAISYYRKHQKFHGEIGLDNIHEPSNDASVIDQISAEEILALVQQLKPIYRTVFTMHVVDGYQLREIADVLNFNEATVRSHFSRARTRLQELIKQSYPLFSEGKVEQKFK
ncbi:RNA polymerase sigma-70 factor (ECF subfamily) [Runella defluvii]|uniref:RNA polymerase sigma-70 factor (ECF subfamily) n=1 Tax=Runella defluvii TaxID=370973 RepID=A0A7W6EP33_9BACT|nr:RNA polymerase sigma factor [Runella defluvii]MBB3837043.1 RNA polymerase sigma-70 factor (ECF subfamily) [Runella defluvii]